MKKRWAAMFTAAIGLGLCLCLFCGCKPVEVEEKPFYTLEEAYHYGWLKKTDLKSIAKLVNNHTSLDIEGLENEALTAIKDSYAALRNAEPDEVTVIYYGNFNNHIAVDLSIYGDLGSTVIKEVTVGGVKFVYPHSAAEVVIYRIK